MRVQFGTDVLDLDQVRWGRGIELPPILPKFGRDVGQVQGRVDLGFGGGGNRFHAPFPG